VCKGRSTKTRSHGHTNVICRAPGTGNNRIEAPMAGPRLGLILRIGASKMPTIGYARVSTRDQDLTAQLDALKAAGAETIYREKVSGVRADRPQLTKLTAKLMPGDVAVVTKLDRLGRSTRELLELIERIGKAGAAFRSLGDPLFDTTGAQGRLLVTMLANIAEFRARIDPREDWCWS
jgi:Resolvase, N terminal domain